MRAFRFLSATLSVMRFEMSGDSRRHKLTTECMSRDQASSTFPARPDELHDMATRFRTPSFCCRDVEPYDIDVLTPDQFLAHQFHLNLDSAVGLPAHLKVQCTKYGTRNGGRPSAAENPANLLPHSNRQRAGTG
jgi:hypothetical protein